MLCAVYKSLKKDETYLYVKGREQFDAVPKALLETFGKPAFVMMFSLDKREKMAQVSPDKIKQSLAEQGYYLQLPPPKENLLKSHLASHQQSSQQEQE